MIRNVLHGYLLCDITPPELCHIATTELCHKTVPEIFLWPFMNCVTWPSRTVSYGHQRPVSHLLPKHYILMAIPELCHLTTQELFHLATLHMSHHHIATPGLCHMATLSYVTSLCLAARKLGRLVTDVLGSCGRQTILAKESRGEN